MMSSVNGGVGKWAGRSIRQVSGIVIGEGGAARVLIGILGSGETSYNEETPSFAILSDPGRA